MTVPRSSCFRTPSSGSVSSRTNVPSTSITTRPSSVRYSRASAEPSVASGAKNSKKDSASTARTVCAVNVSVALYFARSSHGSDSHAVVTTRCAHSCRVVGSAPSFGISGAADAIVAT